MTPEDKTSSSGTSPSNHSVSKASKKETRWRPSPDQLKYLKTYFQSNKYPTIEQREKLLNDMNSLFNSQITLNQLSNWLQKKRSKESRESEKTEKDTKIYHKFSEQDLEYLSSLFEEVKYPKLEDMVITAKKLSVKLSKVENWYKHSRRALAKHGLLELQQRKYFGPDELVYIQQRFDANQFPSPEEYQDMADYLKCDVAQVKNWYANKKKKIKTQIKESEREPSIELLKEEDGKDLEEIADFGDQIRYNHKFTSNKETKLTKSLPKGLADIQNERLKEYGLDLSVKNHNNMMFVNNPTFLQNNTIYMHGPHPTNPIMGDPYSNPMDFGQYTAMMAYPHPYYPMYFDPSSYYPHLRGANHTSMPIPNKKRRTESRTHNSIKEDQMNDYLIVNNHQFSGYPPNYDHMYMHPMTGMYPLNHPQHLQYPMPMMVHNNIHPDQSKNFHELMNQFNQQSYFELPKNNFSPSSGSNI